MTPPAAIRVPRDGMAWLDEASDRQEESGTGSRLVPAGVTFDSLETARVLGANVIAWLLAERRPIGPVALDTIAGRTRFLVPPGSRTTMPDVVAELVGAGSHVRLPGAVTVGDACLRWLIVPRRR